MQDRVRATLGRLYGGGDVPLEHAHAPAPTRTGLVRFDDVLDRKPVPHGPRGVEGVRQRPVEQVRVGDDSGAREVAHREIAGHLAQLQRAAALPADAHAAAEHQPQRAAPGREPRKRLGVGLEREVDGAVRSIRAGRPLLHDARVAVVDRDVIVAEPLQLQPVVELATQRCRRRRQRGDEHPARKLGLALRHSQQ